MSTDRELDRALERALDAVSGLTPREAVTVLETALAKAKDACNEYQRRMGGY